MLLMMVLCKQDYELQLVAYSAQVEPLSAPLKKTKLDSASDNIIQEVCFYASAQEITYKIMHSFMHDLFTMKQYEWKTIYGGCRADTRTSAELE